MFVRKCAAAFFCSITMLCFLSCYSVFYGGTGGVVVDMESTVTPKAGIANVDVYAYTDSSQRDSDYKSYKEGYRFVPSASYYGHTTTGADGTFTLSRIVWKTGRPAFGKDADVSELYLLFYHENYGLTKGSSLIVSDSTSDTIYQELTAVRKTTVLSIRLVDVATNAPADSPVYVRIEVPQTTAADASVPARIYEATYTGTGALSISYPRWQDADRTKTTSPQIKISYYQNAEKNEVSWKACRNPSVDDSVTDYSFLEDGFTLTKEIPGVDSYPLSLYGKRCRFPVPKFSGQYRSDAEDSNGKQITLLVDGEYCGTVTTGPQITGTESGTEKNGRFSGLGSGTWAKDVYPEKYAEASATFKVDGKTATSPASVTIRSDVSSYWVKLN